MDTWQALRAIAEAVRPADPHRTTVYEVEAYDHALHTDPKARRDEVLLRVELRHQRDYFDPIDACETRCLGEIKSAVNALGSHEGRWPGVALDPAFAPADH